MIGGRCLNFSPFWWLNNGHSTIANHEDNQNETKYLNESAIKNEILVENITKRGNLIIKDKLVSFLCGLGRSR